MFDHERLDVYRVSLEFVKWTYDNCSKISGQARYARDQIIRASQSIPQNIAEGNGKRTIGDRRRFFEIARGSAFECASILDVLLIVGSISVSQVTDGKKLLHRIVSMLTKMTVRNDGVKEDQKEYESELEIDEECE